VHTEQLERSYHMDIILESQIKVLMNMRKLISNLLVPIKYQPIYERRKESSSFFLKDLQEHCTVI
jgi:hypothetical protein